MMKPARLAAVVLLLLTPAARADDWPTFGGNPARTHASPQPVPAGLESRWVGRRAHPPTPAWPVSSRMPFDRADHPVAAGDAVYVGSSADGKVYALDAATGVERWAAFTGGPVRFAPAVADGRVFVASDDGFLHCLAAADGKTLWTKRGGPGPEMVLGNDRMVSRWPARGGPVVADGVVYFAAGIWPSEGIYLHALDAATGKTVWVNDSSGSIAMAQPHGGAFADSGVSAQGYLVVTGDRGEPRPGRRGGGRGHPRRGAPIECEGVGRVQVGGQEEGGPQGSGGPVHRARQGVVGHDRAGRRLATGGRQHRGRRRAERGAGGRSGEQGGDVVGRG